MRSAGASSASAGALRTPQAYPGRCVVAGVLLAAHPAIHPGVFQVVRQAGAEQQVVDAQPGVALPVLAEVVPEGIDAPVGETLA